MVVGPALMIVNKRIMDPKGSIVFPYPLFVSSLGLLFTACATIVLRLTGYLELEHEHLMTRKFWILRILPVGVCHAGTLAFGNAQYLYMGVALIQFLKAFTPIVVTIISLLILKRKVTLRVWLMLLIICCGTSMTAMGEAYIQYLGLFLAFGSSTTEAIRLVLTQFALQDCKMSLLESQYHMAPVAALALLLLSYFLEYPKMVAEDHLDALFLYKGEFLLAATLGLGVQLLTSNVIQMTSSTTLKVISQLRNALVVLAGPMLFHEGISFIQVVGYLISVAGVYGYAVALSK